MTCFTCSSPKRLLPCVAKWRINSTISGAQWYPAVNALVLRWDLAGGRWRVACPRCWSSLWASCHSPIPLLTKSDLFNHNHQPCTARGFTGRGAFALSRMYVVPQPTCRQITSATVHHLYLIGTGLALYIPALSCAITLYQGLYRLSHALQRWLVNPSAVNLSMSLGMSIMLLIADNATSAGSLIYLSVPIVFMQIGPASHLASSFS